MASPEVLVVIGVGGMGRAIASRLGAGRRVLLADADEDALVGAAEVLAGNGHDVVTETVDVSDPDAVAALAAVASDLGAVRSIAHTAGLSPVQASTEAILRVDLFGVAYVLEEFEPVVALGGAAVVIASMAGQLAAPLTHEEEHVLASTPARELPNTDVVQRRGAEGYGFAKRANQVRVQAASLAWGRRGARVNSISPGIISTPMGRAEMDGPGGTMMQTMIESSALRRLGTPDDIAACVDFLLGPAAAFVTGTDLLVDGGTVAALTIGQPDLLAAMSPDV